MRSAAAIIALLGSLTAGVSLDALFKSSNPSGTASQIACATKNQIGGATWTDPASCGVALSANAPSADNQPLCGTAAGAASFDTAANCGLAVSSNAPTASGNVLCGTSSTAASFESPSTCSLASTSQSSFLMNDTGTTTSAPAQLGWSPLATNANHRLVFGDPGGGSIQGGYGTQLQIISFSGVTVQGGTASSSAQTFRTGNGASDPSLTVISSTNGGLRIDSHAGTVGTPISWSGRTTPTLTFTIAAQSCGDTTPGTLTGAALGADCIISARDTSGATYGVSMSCGVPAANQVSVHVCNPTTSSVTVTSKVFSIRVFNP